MIKKVKVTLRWKHVIEDLNGEEVAGTFYEKELQKKKKKIKQSKNKIKFKLDLSNYASKSDLKSATSKRYIRVC